MAFCVICCVFVHFFVLMCSICANTPCLEVLSVPENEPISGENCATYGLLHCIHISEL